MDLLISYAFILHPFWILLLRKKIPNFPPFFMEKNTNTFFTLHLFFINSDNIINTNPWTFYVLGLNI